MELLIAFAMDNGKTFNDDHFGMAKYYHICRSFDDGEELVEQRENVEFQEHESQNHGDPAKAQATSSVLKGVDVLVNKECGPNITRMVPKFACVVVRTNAISDAIAIVEKERDEVIKEKNKTKERRNLTFEQ
jgi:predicted Fe-Mo cluster-binding NifX family protein